MAQLTSMGPARSQASGPASVSITTASLPSSSNNSHATQRVALPQASTSRASTLHEYICARVPGLLDNDQLIATDTRLRIADANDFLIAGMIRLLARIRDHEVIAEAMHFDEEPSRGAFAEGWWFRHAEIKGSRLVVNGRLYKQAFA
jgi:hypothetical protein